MFWRFIDNRCVLWFWEYEPYVRWTDVLKNENILQ